MASFVDKHGCSWTEEACRASCDRMTRAIAIAEKDRVLVSRANGGMKWSERDEIITPEEHRFWFHDLSLEERWEAYSTAMLRRGDPPEYVASTVSTLFMVTMGKK